MKRSRNGARRGKAWPALLLGAVVAAAFAGAQSAPKRPPEPFPVFVEAIGTDDETLRERLEEAVAEVAKRVARRRHWFRVAESAEDAVLTLRLTDYRIGSGIVPRLSKQSLARGSTTMMAGTEVVDIHYLYAAAHLGGKRDILSLEERDAATSLRKAADHLAEELERFCRENYPALTVRPPGDDEPGPTTAGTVRRPGTRSSIASQPVEAPAEEAP